MMMKNIVLRHHQLPEEETVHLFSPFKSVLAQVFAATGDLQYVQNILDRLTALLPGVTIIGCSSDGTIDNGVIYPYGDTVQVSLTGFEHTALTLAHAAAPEGDSFALGEMLYDRVYRDDTKVIIAFSEAAGVNGELFLDGLERKENTVAVSGGVASTPTFADTFVIAGGHIVTNGAVAVALNGDQLRFYTDYLFGWEPIGKEMVVTSVDNNIIHTIDNRPPLSIFQHYLGEEIAALLPGIGSAFPLILYRDGENIARGIIAVDGESLIVSGNVKEGDKVFIGYGNAQMITHKNNFNDHLQKALPCREVLFNYYCEGRHLFLPPEAVDIETERMGENGPVTGCFTLGEFFTRRKHILHNFSSTVLALSENDILPGDAVAVDSHTLSDQEKLSSVITKGLFNLIDVRTRELEHQSYHDVLTDLPNRLFFSETLANEIEKARSSGHKLAVFFMDLDHFKDVNDTLGHGSGDALLKAIGHRFRSELHPDDLLARWSGDEFVILLRNYASLEMLMRLAAELIAVFDDPVPHDGHLFSLGISIGISLFPADGEDAETLIKHADAAMYDVKYSGRNSFSFYRKEMTEQALQRISLENDLRAALKEEQFFVVYQPQIDFKDGKMQSAEALLRWRHPDRGVIMPETFIAVAERSGLILPIGEMVFDIALGQFKAWKAQRLPITKICVNVSAKQFRFDNIVGVVNKYLAKHDLTPGNLEIELTESTLVRHNKETFETLEELHRIGVSVSIDDFGTGYSSLSYLQRLKINSIKIDKSFVENLPDNANDKAIVKAIIAMAHALELDVIVEGIENSRQNAFFISESCTLAQGYFYAEPLTAERFEQRYLEV